MTLVDALADLRQEVGLLKHLLDQSPDGKRFERKLRNRMTATRMAMTEVSESYTAQKADKK